MQGQCAAVIMSEYEDGSRGAGMSLAPAQQQCRGDMHILPHVMLPSHRYRYSVWHELANTSVKGSDLKAPRIRHAPQEKEELFYRMRDSSNRHIHHTLQGQERKNYRDEKEHWEGAVICNLSYQDLQHTYQRYNFYRVLKRLVIVEELNLIEDTLTDLHGITFPKCVHLNLSKNHLKSFHHLPTTPCIRELILTCNCIRSLDGLEALRKTPIEHIVLKENPIAFTLNYRPNVFQKLPPLRTLDDLQKVPADSQFHTGVIASDNNSRCVVS